MSEDLLMTKMNNIETKLDILLQALIGGGLKGLKLSGQETFSDSTQKQYLHSLTTKQHCALQMLMGGRDNSDIANRMGITINTAKVHVRGIAKKLGVSTRTQIIHKLTKEMSKINDSDYEVSSGGLPKDWHENYTDPDEHKFLYATKKK